jgi:uncharacterized membrane-anchored protein
MYKKTIIVTLVLILSILNYSIYQKEHQLKNATTVILPLAPVDPRSMMQGDYMRLNYALSREVRRELSIKRDMPKEGFVIVHLNDKHIASFMKLYEGEKLNPNELKLPFKVKNYNQVSFGGNTFFFQEGNEEKYQKAKYGLFKLSGESMILQSLLDENLTVID